MKRSYRLQFISWLLITHTVPQHFRFQERLLSVSLQAQKDDFVIFAGLSLCMNMHLNIIGSPTKIDEQYDLRGPINYFSRSDTLSQRGFDWEIKLALNPFTVVKMENEKRWIGKLRKNYTRINSNGSETWIQGLPESIQNVATLGSNFPISTVSPTVCQQAKFSDTRRIMYKNHLKEDTAT